MMKKFLFGYSKHLTKQSYIWYSLGGLLNAGQSALLLLFISRTNSIEDSGVYSIAYAIACLTQTIGNFGMRNFQATDVQRKYSFSCYLSSRLITDIALLIVTAFYMGRGYFFFSYSFNKCAVILFLCLLKLVDSMEDVFHGMYQNRGRLDVAGRCMMTRYAIMLLTFSGCLMVFHNLVISSAIACFISLGYFILTTFLVFPYFGIKIEKICINKSVIKLLSECISLFLGTFLIIYVANAPKYAIDKYRTAQEQACFNYIFMPVYVISVLNTFIYQPMLTKMASFYEEGNKKQFLNLFLRQIIIIISLVIIVLLGGFLLGIPILGWLYNTNLMTYKSAFMILLVGSGFLAMQGYFSAILTIMRKQNWLIIGYGVSATIALGASKTVILGYGINGAAVLYSSTICIQMLIFGILFIVFWGKSNRQNK